MPSVLDDRFAAAVAAITGPGGPVEAVGDGDGRMVARHLPATLPDFFALFCARHADATAIVAGEERLTFAELNAIADRVARALAGRGIGRGDRVGIAMRNAPAWIAAHMGVLNAGAISTLVNGWWQPGELADGLALTTPALLIADPERAGRLAEAGATAPIVTLDPDQALEVALAPLLDGPAGALPEVRPDDDATILFTSGSTGRAKGAVSTHRQVTTGIYSFLTYTAALYRLAEEDAALPKFPPAALVGLPLFHVTGEVPVLLMSFAIGRKLVLMRRWDAGEALRLVEAERVTYFVGVPTMSLEMLQHPDVSVRDTGSLSDIVAGGAARPVAHVPRLQAAFPKGHPMMGYGLTETNAVGCTNFRANYIAKPASTGRWQAPYVHLAIVDEAGAPVRQGETGEIAILSRANIRGYWQDPEATARAFTADGHFRTGDLGYLDEDDYLFIVDRAKDIIIRGGENISCLEVEAAIYAHPAVAEASVFGLPDDRLGEVPAAALHLKAGERLETAEFDAFLTTKLARFKRPERLWIEDVPLPKLGTGKIDKKTLRARYGA